MTNTNWELATTDEILEGMEKEIKRIINIDIKILKKRKIKRRIHYTVMYYENGTILKCKFFESAKAMRKYVNILHKKLPEVFKPICIEKSWCYRNYTPVHKWFYESWEPNQFICVERF